MIEWQSGLSLLSAGVAMMFDICTEYVYGEKYHRLCPFRLGLGTDDLSRLWNRDFRSFCRLDCKRLNCQPELCTTYSLYGIWLQSI